MSTPESQSGERHDFQAEITRLLHLMVHSVYSEKEVFLRELISNASDACDKLRYRAVTEPALIADDPEFAIRITLDADAGTLTIADNGIGMTRDELIENLGTIAKSGTDAFASALADSQKAGAGEGEAVALIGKFGVGFYSCFMVSDFVRVVSARAGSNEAHAWESDGQGSFDVKPADLADLPSARGTAITLQIREDDAQYLDPVTVRGIIRGYSNHISFPISLKAGGKDAETETAEADGAADGEEVVNEGTAIWTRARSDITDEQYKEFYHHVSPGFDDPWHTIHYRAEGRHEYTVLLFIPTDKPLDLYEPERQCRVKLYVNRVFITGDAPILPPYLRFARGVIDSSDIPLTISREMLQNNPLVRTIGSAVTKRVLSELTKIASHEPERFEAFWSAFGPVLKEGLYEDAERRDQILDLARFKTTKSGESVRSLKDYVEGLQDNQTAIYYITGESPASVASSPQLEGYRSRDIEVLLLSDPVDAFWVAAVSGYDGKPFKSVTRGAADFQSDPKEEADSAGEKGLAVLIAAFQQALGEEVKAVRKSDRLTESAVCLVADDTGLDMHIEKILKLQGQELPSARVLEINPGHDLIKSLAARAEGGVDGTVDEVAHLLYDLARVQQGESIADTAQFASRLQSALTRSLAGQ